MIEPKLPVPPTTEDSNDTDEIPLNDGLLNLSKIFSLTTIADPLLTVMLLTVNWLSVVENNELLSTDTQVDSDPLVALSESIVGNFTATSVKLATPLTSD